MDTFKLNGKEFKLAAIKTPGDSPDQISTVLIKDNKIDFIHLGEALGILSNPEKSLTIPSSSAPDFNYESYMHSIRKLKKVYPLNAGFCHFGLVSGIDNISEIKRDHESCVTELRQYVIKFYQEKPETRYCANKITPIVNLRSDTDADTAANNPAIFKLILSLLYGMLMDLGYRS